MRSRAGFQGPPIHRLLFAFPVALWTFALACDLTYYAASPNAVWKAIAFYSMLGGIGVALAAAVPGLIEYIAIRDQEVKRVATAHIILNLIVVVLFIFNLGMRFNAPADPDQQLFDTIMSVVGILLMAVAGWLSGSLVYVHPVGVQTAEESFEQERRAA